MQGYECVLMEYCAESYLFDFKQAVLQMARARGAIVRWTAASVQVSAAG